MCHPKWMMSWENKLKQLQKKHENSKQINYYMRNELSTIDKKSLVSEK